MRFKIVLLAASLLMLSGCPADQPETSFTPAPTSSGGSSAPKSDVNVAVTYAGSVDTQAVRRVQILVGAETVHPGQSSTLQALAYNGTNQQVYTDWTWAQVGSANGDRTFRGVLWNVGGGTARWDTISGYCAPGPVKIYATAPSGASTSATVTVANDPPVITGHGVSPVTGGAETDTDVQVQRGVDVTFQLTFQDPNGWLQDAQDGNYLREATPSVSWGGEVIQTSTRSADALQLTSSMRATFTKAGTYQVRLSVIDGDLAPVAQQWQVTVQ